MSELNDFFAKKDRKKKKAGLKSAQAAAISDGTKLTDAATDVARTNATAAPPKQPDDGWIELEDPKGAQVNTGGRTVVEFKRDVDDKDINSDGNAQSEKFSGWTKSQDEDADGEDGNAESSAPPAASTAFPTLADAANAPKVPISRGRSSGTSGSSYSSAPGRPRFINSSKLREKLAERTQASTK